MISWLRPSAGAAQRRAELRSRIQQWVLDRLPDFDGSNKEPEAEDEDEDDMQPEVTVNEVECLDPNCPTHIVISLLFDDPSIGTVSGRLKKSLESITENDIDLLFETDFRKTKHTGVLGDVFATSGDKIGLSFPANGTHEAPDGPEKNGASVKDVNNGTFDLFPLDIRFDEEEFDPKWMEPSFRRGVDGQGQHHWPISGSGGSGGHVVSASGSTRGRCPCGCDPYSTDDLLHY